MPSRANLWTALAIVVYSVLLLAFADTRIMPGLDMDRYAFMESLVERGKVTVDESAMKSVDRIKIGDHFYSGKPPVMNFAGAAFYWPLHHGLGWKFSDGETAPRLVRTMIFAFVTLPVAATLWMVWLAGGGGGRPRRGAAALALVALASPVPVYGLVFTNHPLAMALLMGAFMARRGAVIGLLAGLSATVDLIPGALFLAGYGAMMLLEPADIRRAVALAAGAAGPLALHLALNRATLGTWNTSYLVKGAFDYEGSVWTAAIDHLDYESFDTYAAGLWHYTLGHRGALWLVPLATWGLVSSALAAWRGAAKPAETLDDELAMQDRPHARSLAAATFAAGAGVLLLVPKFSMGLAGATYGPRHLLPAVPLLFAYLPVPFPARGQTRRRTVFALMAAAGMAITGIGCIDPWTPYTMSVYAPLDVAAAATTRLGWRDLPGTIVTATAHRPSFGWQELGYHAMSAANAVRDPSQGAAGTTGRADRTTALEAEMRRRQLGEMALEAYMTCLKLQPDRLQAIYAAAVVAGDLGKYDTAIRLFTELTGRDPKNAGAWANLGQTLQRAGRTGEARPFYEKAFSLNPDSRAAMNGIATARLNSGDRDGAALYLRRLLRVYPGDRSAARMLEQTGRPREGPEIGVRDAFTSGGAGN